MVVFPKCYAVNRLVLTEDAKVVIKGKVSVEDGKDAGLMAENITAFDDIPQSVWIRFDSMKVFEKMDKEVEKLLDEMQGKDTGVFYITEGKKKAVKLNRIKCNTDNLARLRELAGEKNIAVTY